MDRETKLALMECHDAMRATTEALSSMWQTLSFSGNFSRCSLGNDAKKISDANEQLRKLKTRLDHLMTTSSKPIDNGRCPECDTEKVIPPLCSIPVCPNCEGLTLQEGEALLSQITEVSDGSSKCSGPCCENNYTLRCAKCDLIIGLRHSNLNGATGLAWFDRRLGTRGMYVHRECLSE